MDWREQATVAFREVFGGEPEAVSDAGGRVNLIGEHTDYHEGYVFPAAIDLRTRAAGRRRADGLLRVRAVNVGAEVTIAVAELRPPAEVDWRAYVLGPFWALRESGWEVPGADVLVGGEVPFGGGLSSSASIEVALVGLGAALAGREIVPTEVARIARLAENRYAGVPCGAMDQVASACGRLDHALILDCRTLAVTHVPFPSAWTLVVADSMVRHTLAAGEYARRQQECAEGMAVVRTAYPAIRAARDLTMSELDALRGRMAEVSYRRLRHVVTEDDRVLAARDALVAGDGAVFGRLLAGSHESLARDYEVSCPELDALVAVAGALPGCLGARLTGAGFGGNTVNVVRAEAAAAFCEALVPAYEERTGRRTTARVVRPAAGWSVARP